MPLEPVIRYDGARYPTLEEMAPRRREFLSRVGLAAIAAAFGPHVIACSGSGTADSAHRGPEPPPPATPPPTPPPTPVPTPMPLAGVPAPATWPGPRGAIVGGGPVEVTYADGGKGWVVAAVVFEAGNDRLESALVDAEIPIAEAIRERLRREQAGCLTNPKRTRAAEAALLAAIRTIVGIGGVQSVSLAEVDAEAVRPARPQALPPASAAPAPAIVPAAPAAAPRMEAMELAAPPIRRLPRAGARCPIHPHGCRQSDAGG
jgi:hypothetical protein